jgi:hypothetical protein
MKVYNLLMNTGSQHHRTLEMAISMVGGFAASFLTFLFASTTRLGGPIGGQLVAGDPAINAQFPTTLHTIQNTVGGNSSIMSAMTSYGWWVGVVICGFIGTIIIFKLMRRYV